MQASTTDGANSPATSSALPAPVASSTARPTVGLSRWTTTEMSSRMSRTISAVSTLRRSLACVHTTARAPATPAARSNAPGSPSLDMCGQPQLSTSAAIRAEGSSSSTTTCTSATRSCSTVRRPTPSRPHTITWPVQCSYSPGAGAARGSEAPPGVSACAAPDTAVSSGICVVEGSVCPRSLTPPRHIRFSAARLYVSRSRTERSLVCRRPGQSPTEVACASLGA